MNANDIESFVPKRAHCTAGEGRPAGRQAGRPVRRAGCTGHRHDIGYSREAAELFTVGLLLGGVVRVEKLLSSGGRGDL